MLRFIVRRLIVIVPMVLIVVSLTWGLIKLAVVFEIVDPDLKAIVR